MPSSNSSMNGLTATALPARILSSVTELNGPDAAGGDDGVRDAGRDEVGVARQRRPAGRDGAEQDLIFASASSA